MKRDNNNNSPFKELVFYVAILIALIILVICNNVFWKFGKQEVESNNNITRLQSNNVIYNVPYQEEWLD